MMNSIMAQIESECDKIKLPDILDAMVIVNKSWELVTQETIKNCFKKAFFEFETFIHDQSDKDMIDSCIVCMQEDDLICREPEMKITETTVSSPSIMSDEELEKDIKDNSIISTKEAISYLGKIHEFFKKRDPRMLSNVVDLEFAVYDLKKSESIQTKITDLFKPKITE